MSKVIITSEGGLVQSVYSTDPTIEVIVLDEDIEGADDDEIISLEEFHEFMENHQATAIDYKSGVIECSVPSMLSSEIFKDEKGE